MIWKHFAIIDIALKPCLSKQGKVSVRAIDERKQAMTLPKNTSNVSQKKKACLCFDTGRRWSVPLAFSFPSYYFMTELGAMLNRFLWYACLVY